jgi:hypothetical protein
VDGVNAYLPIIIAGVRRELLKSVAVDEFLAAQIAPQDEAINLLKKELIKLHTWCSMLTFTLRRAVPRNCNGLVSPSDLLLSNNP